MAKVRRKSTSIWWTDDLDDMLVEREIEEAIVDAYTHDEREAGVICHVENELNVPFHAEVLGEKLTVVDVNGPWAAGTAWIWSWNAMDADIESKSGRSIFFRHIPKGISRWRPI